MLLRFLVLSSLPCALTQTPYCQMEMRSVWVKGVHFWTTLFGSNFARGENNSLSDSTYNMFLMGLYPNDRWCNVSAGKYLFVAPWLYLVMTPHPPHPPIHWLFLNFSFTATLTPTFSAINIKCFPLARMTFMVRRERGTGGPGRWDAIIYIQLYPGCKLMNNPVAFSVSLI